MEMSTTEVLNQGMKCLVNGMGLVDAERFVAAVMREKFDYTKWQRDHFDKKSPEQLHTEAVQYAEEHPYKGKAKIRCCRSRRWQMEMGIRLHYGIIQTKWGV